MDIVILMILIIATAAVVALEYLVLDFNLPPIIFTTIISWTVIGALSLFFNFTDIAELLVIIAPVLIGVIARIIVSRCLSSD